MKCVFCRWICDRFLSDEAGKDPIWSETERWEHKYNSDWEPWQEFSDEEWIQIDSAAELCDSDRPAALAIYRELAENGYVWAMNRAGWHYRHGVGTDLDHDKAEEFFYRAIEAGSWRATVLYADLLFEQEHHEHWSHYLNNGVEEGYIPAFFRLAWFRYHLNPTRKIARDVAPLLEKAMEAGHPGAEMVLVRWTSLGKLGLRKIPKGMRMLSHLVAKMRSHEEDVPKGKIA